MKKFHVSANGNPEPCTATKRACPRGGEEAHFASQKDAAAAAIQEQLRTTETRIAELDKEHKEVQTRVRIQEARVRFLENGHSARELQEREMFAESAPLELREHFYSDSPFNWDWSDTFNASGATHALITAEHGEGRSDAKDAALQARLGHRGRQDGKPPLLDSVTRIARPDFVNDDEWQNSDERAVMATHLPNALARFEEEVAVRHATAA